jgi:C-8 sterol isomerase
VSHVLEPEVLHRIVRRRVGKDPIELVVEEIHADLRAEYRDHIVAEPEWVLNVAGGAMGHFMLLHSSITEYLMIFGTPIGTEGHTGRFFATDYFFILEGEQWAYAEGQMTRSEYQPGDMHVLPQGTAKGYRMPGACHALEYARGFIPSMLPFGLADAFTSTLDARSVAKTFRMYGTAVVGNLMRGKI